MGGFAGLIDFTERVTTQDRAILNIKDSLRQRTDAVYLKHLSDTAVLIQGFLPQFIDEHKINQPAVKSDKGDELVITFNGRLYNKERIRNQLKALGRDCSCQTDAQVALAAYAALGTSCLNYFDGMFAFSIWHTAEKKLFLARDRSGAKPLFYSNFKGGLVFGSELKIILNSGKVQKVVDDYGLKQMLLLGPGRSVGKTPIKNVFELAPGECAFFDADGLIKFKYWKLKAEDNRLSVSDNIDKTESLVKDAIKKQSDTDRTLACFLSGGLDSGIICKIVADEFEKSNKKLATFSVDYEDNDKFFVKNSFQPSYDGDYIKLMSDFIGSEHKNIVLNNLDVAAAIDSASLARDIPGMADIDSSLLLFADAVKDECDICLSGEAADELFGGYPWYFDESILYSRSFPWSSDLSVRKNLFKAEFIGTDADDYVMHEYEKIINMTDYLSTDNERERRMREMFVLNYYSFMQTLIDRKDRMTMHSGLEVRMPFSDGDIVQYAYNIPWEIKALGGREKGLLRKAFAKHLPPEITERKKSPYPKTFNPLFLKYVTEKATSIVESGGITSQMINKEYFYILANSAGEMQTPWYGQLMRLPQIFAYIMQIDSFFKRFELNIE